MKCPNCKVDLIVKYGEYRYGDNSLQGVEGMHCPSCGRVTYTNVQYTQIRRRIEGLAKLAKSK